MGDYVSIALLGLLGLTLVSAGIEDARTRQIANWKNACVALAAPLWWWAMGYNLWPDAALQIGIAGIVFALFVVAFHFGQMGGGDVKLIGALALWLPFTALVWMLVVMSMVGGVVTLLMLIEARLKRNKQVLEIPYGVAIAIAGLLWIREPIINQFG